MVANAGSIVIKIQILLADQHYSENLIAVKDNSFLADDFLFFSPV